MVIFMDIDRLKILSGLQESDYSAVTPYSSAANTQTAKQTSAMKKNNADTKSTTFADASLQDYSVQQSTDKALTNDKSNSTFADASLQDYSVKSPSPSKTVKADSKSVERLDNQTEIEKTGEPKISTELKLNKIKVESWVAAPDFATKFLAVKLADQYVAENLELVDWCNDVALFDLDSAAQVSALIEGSEIVEIQLVDPNSELLESQLVLDSELGSILESNVAPTNRIDNIRSDIESRLGYKQKIYLAVNCKGKMFAGTITRATNVGLFVIPTADTVERYAIQSPTNVLVPIDYSAVHWSEKKANVLVGYAKDIDLGQDNTDSGRSEVGHKPATGSYNDPSSFKVDMSSFTPTGNKLDESAILAKSKAVRELERKLDKAKQEKNTTEVDSLTKDIAKLKGIKESSKLSLTSYLKRIVEGDVDDLQKTLKGLRVELKDAKADEDDELIADIEAEIQLTQRRLAKCTAATVCEADEDGYFRDTLEHYLHNITDVDVDCVNQILADYDARQLDPKFLGDGYDYASDSGASLGYNFDDVCELYDQYCRNN